MGRPSSTPCFPQGSPFWIQPLLPRVALSNRGYQQTNSITSRSTNDFKCHSGPLSWPVCRPRIPFDFVLVVLVVLVVWATPPFVFSLDGRRQFGPPIHGESRRGIQLFHGGHRDFFLLFLLLLLFASLLSNGFLPRWAFSFLRRFNCTNPMKVDYYPFPWQSFYKFFLGNSFL